jgi:hypothetical protein
LGEGERQAAARPALAFAGKGSSGIGPGGEAFRRQSESRLKPRSPADAIVSLTDRCGHR